MCWWEVAWGALGGRLCPLSTPASVLGTQVWAQEEVLPPLCTAGRQETLMWRRGGSPKLKHTQPWRNPEPGARGRRAEGPGRGITGHAGVAGLCCWGGGLGFVSNLRDPVSPRRPSPLLFPVWAGLSLALMALGSEREEGLRREGAWRTGCAWEGAAGGPWGGWMEGDGGAAEEHAGPVGPARSHPIHRALAELF